MRWLKQLFARRRRYDELAGSIREHIEEMVEDLVEGGMQREEAEQAARREFGNVTLIEERSREVWQWPALESIWADVRYALRQMQNARGFSSICILTLAIGIGANAAVFSVVDAVVLDPLPYSNASRLVDVQSLDRNSHQSLPVSYPDFLDWRAQNRTLEHLVSYRAASYTLTGLQQAVNVDAEVASWDLLPALGVTPEIGRGFTPDEEKPGTHSALISHELWRSQFHGDKGILGRPIHLSGKLFTVVGVMRPSFRFPLTAPRTGIWTTLAVDNDPGDPSPHISTVRGFNFLNVIGERRPAVQIDRVRQDMDVLATNLAKQYPDTNTHHSGVLVQTELAALLGDTRTTLFLVQGAVALVLLIACTNIAGLLLARMRERQREIAMRTALGAGRLRVARQLLVESMVLGLAGGIAGCGLAFAATPLILSLVGERVPRAAHAGVSLHVLASAMLLSLASAVIFGVVPAITACRTDLVSSLKTGGQREGTGRDWLRPSLIVAQVALGLVLTTGAGLMMTSFAHLRSADQGFHTDHLLTFLFVLPEARYSETRAAFYREYFDKVRALPGVESAAGTINLPMTRSEASTRFEDAEHPAAKSQKPAAGLVTVSTEYFRTMQTPLIQGRDFTDHDDVHTPPVVIVSRQFAKRYFPGEDAIGKKLKLENTQNDSPWREIVGVVGDMRFAATQRDVAPVMYVPQAQSIHSCCLYTVIRTRLDPAALENTVEHVVAGMDRDLPITEVSTMDRLVSSQLAQPRFAMVLLGMFAALALLLTIAGLYGVMTYTVSRRTREIGVRMALGAQRRTVLMAILREAAILLGIGSMIGGAGAFASTSILRNLLYGTAPRDPLIFSTSILLIAACGLLAALIPAMRAASTNPVQALRND